MLQQVNRGAGIERKRDLPLDLVVDELQRLIR